MILIADGTREDAVATVEESIKIDEMALLYWHQARQLLILINCGLKTLTLSFSDS